MHALFITVKIAVPAAVANSALSAEAERLLRQQAGTAVERGKQKKSEKKKKAREEDGEVSLAAVRMLSQEVFGRVCRLT